MGKNREDNIKLSKFEYDTLLKYTNYYYNKYSLSKKKNDQLYKDIIFSNCINKYIKLKNHDITNQKMIARYISLLVKGVVIDYFKSKTGSFNNDYDYELEDESYVSAIENVNKRINDFDVYTFYETLTTCILGLTDKEKILLSYLMDNTDSYKESISKICKDLNFTRYEYDKYINKIQNLFKKYYF